ncbi:MAG: SulP family inorganic anion transporter [Methylomonas sp.]|nr:SulP family inorganic anion transporter [Methylomonas sp.]
MKSLMHDYLKHLNQDLPAGIVVFLVALPLCLGVALASGAPLFSGIIAGIVGGLLVSWASGSQLSVSGPAAGLTVIVFNAIETLGSFQVFLFSVTIAGCLQLALGFLNAGVIGAFFPTSVIKGMLAAIGLILIIKQTPHATGYHSSYEGDESYMQETAESSFFELGQALEGVVPGVTLVSMVALAILIAWDSAFLKRIVWIRAIPGPLVAVFWGIAYNALAFEYAPEWSMPKEQMVSLPALGSVGKFIGQFQFPDFSQVLNPKVFSVAATIAIIASLETLLSVEAVDKLDPHKRITPTNRELKAQGLGNMISGMLGGLPITAVIVRSAANINAGGQSWLSSFFHGLLLLISAIYFSGFLNTIPLACLASILLHTGYKLARPRLFVEFYHKGWNQFLPFIITVFAILISDLLIGITIGMVVGILFVLKANFHQAMTLTQHGSHYLLRLHKDVSFLNKALLREQLSKIPDHCHLSIDGSKALFIDQDILETLSDFMLTANDRSIVVETQGFESFCFIASSPRQ